MGMVEVKAGEWVAHWISIITMRSFSSYTAHPPHQSSNILLLFLFFSSSPPPFWEVSTLLVTINPSYQSCYAPVPGEICERQAMLIHHQFSERLRNYIFFLPSKYWVSHLFVRLGGQARIHHHRATIIQLSNQKLFCLLQIIFSQPFHDLFTLQGALQIDRIQIRITRR